MDIQELETKLANMRPRGKWDTNAHYTAGKVVIETPDNTLEIVGIWYEPDNNTVIIKAK